MDVRFVRKAVRGVGFIAVCDPAKRTSDEPDLPERGLRYLCRPLTEVVRFAVAVRAAFPQIADMPLNVLAILR